MNPHTQPSSTSLRQDLTGGIVSGLMSLPAGLAYGVLVFGPLGAQAASRGVIAGLVTMTLLNLVSAGFRGANTLICSPTSLPTLVMSAAVVSFVGEGLSANAVFTLVTISALLAGIIQVGIGASGLGELVKFVPFPVRCGLLTGTAILMLSSQLPAVLGTSRAEPLIHVKPLAMLVAAVTIGTVWLIRRFERRIPAAVAGLVVGTTAHIALSQRVSGDRLGAVIGHIPSGIPKPTALAEGVSFVQAGGLSGEIAHVLVLAVGLAIVASMETLVAILASDSASGARSNASRELVAQGFGNTVVAAFGGIVGAASPSRSVANYQQGARTTLSRAATGVFALLVISFISPVVGHVPVAVLGGLLFVLAMDLFDRWILGTSLGLLKGNVPNPSVARMNLGIALAVIITMVAVGVIEAVGLGLLLSLVYFVVRMGKQVIRREYDGASLHSNIQRCDREFSLLEREGSRIRVLEMEGSLFFATADKLSRLLEERSSGDPGFIIVDLRRVAELDLTGAEILKTAARRCNDRGAVLMLVYAAHTAVAHDLETLGVRRAVGADNCFGDVNDALGHAEDRLLDVLLHEDRYATDHTLGSFAALSELEPQELEHLESLTVKRTYPDGAIIFTQAEEADNMYFLAKGRARIVAEAPHQPVATSLATLCPGTLLGELALVDKRPRSAGAVADGEVVCYELTGQRFATLLATEPGSAVKLLSGVAREIATRVRIANRTVR